MQNSRSFSLAICTEEPGCSSLGKINYPFHTHFQQESDRGNSPSDLSLNTIFLCVGKGESKWSHEYKIFDSKTIWGRTFAQEIKKKNFQLALKMCTCSYSEVSNCVVSIETSPFTNDRNSNTSVEGKTVRLFKGVSVASEAAVCPSFDSYLDLVNVCDGLTFRVMWNISDSYMAPNQCFANREYFHIWPVKQKDFLEGAYH